MCKKLINKREKAAKRTGGGTSMCVFCGAGVTYLTRCDARTKKETKFQHFLPNAQPFHEIGLKSNKTSTQTQKQAQSFAFVNLPAVRENVRRPVCTRNLKKKIASFLRKLVENGGKPDS